MRLMVGVVVTMGVPMTGRLLGSGPMGPDLGQTGGAVPVAVGFVVPGPARRPEEGQED